MRGYILMPKELEKLGASYTDSFKNLFDSMKPFGFKTLYVTRMPNVLIHGDKIIIFAGAHGKELLIESASLHRAIKVVFYLGGAHVFMRNKHRYSEAMERADLILSGCNALFRKIWPEYQDKFVFFPNFFAPHERYSKLKLPEKPIMQCLLVGNTGAYTYPLRSIINKEIHKNNGLHDMTAVLLHPRWWKGQGPIKRWELAPASAEKYADYLNGYCCTLATASRYRYALMKYFEVPAAGGLLLANDVPDVRAAGLQADKHFVSINKKNFIEKIKDCVTNLDKYKEMRKEAMSYVRENHSIDNRLWQLYQLLEGL